jgi:hypothetical protein
MLYPLSYTSSRHRQESNLRLLVPMYSVPSPRRKLYKSAHTPHLSPQTAISLHRPPRNNSGRNNRSRNRVSNPSLAASTTK